MNELLAVCLLTVKNDAEKLKKLAEKIAKPAKTEKKAESFEKSGKRGETVGLDGGSCVGGVSDWGEICPLSEVEADAFALFR
jgi:hypothetical protein